MSNSGVIAIPCSSGETLEAPDPDLRLNGTVVRVGPHGSLAEYGGAGMTIPWGIAVDDDDNLWIANVQGERLSHLCGAQRP